jgi:hypothetical protein
VALPVPDYSGYERLPSWVLGFHGCDKKVALRVLKNPDKHLRISRNGYDWLGSGVYFWENDPVRAMAFANDGMDGKVSKGDIKDPFVIGAVIDLGLCCNLFDQAALQELSAAHRSLKGRFKQYETPMPINTEKRRMLDREVIEEMHALRQKVGVPEYQTVRAAFPEGDPLYPGTTLTEQNHIQIAVRDTSRIRGYFLPRTQPAPSQVILELM